MSGRSERRRMHVRLVSGAALLAGLSSAAEAGAQPVPVEVVVQSGQTPAGAPGAVSALGAPFTNGTGQVGFIGFAGGVQFVWFDTGIVWLDTDETTLTLGFGDFGRMGVSDTGGFVYGPTVNGNEAAWTDAGLLFQEGDPAPGYPAPAVLTTIEGPMMLPNGDVWFQADVDEDANSSPDAEVIYMSPAGMPTMTAPVLKSGDMVGGFPLTAAGIYNVVWNVSKNGMHTIAAVNMTTGNFADDQAIVVDGMLALQEGGTTGGTDTYGPNFNVVSINDSGNHLVAGLTDGPQTTDGYLAYDGVVAVRELDTLAGLTVDGSPSAASINNLGQAVFIMPDNNFADALFLACDATDIPNTTRVLLMEGNEIDVDNDTVADGTVTDFNADDAEAGPDLDFADDGFVFIEVDVDGNLQTILRLSAACCGDGLVGGNEDCDDMGESATCNADCTSASCGDSQVNATAGEDCDEGGVESATCDSDCTSPACGDGVLNATAGEACDDGGESAACDNDCTPAECGDLLVNAAAGEQCEDGNTDDGDGCSSSCELEGNTGAGGNGAGVGGGAGVGVGGGVGGGGAAPAGTFEAEGGCDCRTSPRSGTSPWGLAALALGAAAATSRRRRRR